VFFGPNDIDAFRIYSKCIGSKVDGFGIRMDLESNVNTLWMKLESGIWEMVQPP